MTALKRLVRPEQVREIVLALIVVLSVLYFGSQIENYYTPRTFNRILSSISILAVVAVGQTLVVLMRNIDLSVGSIVGFTAYFIGTQLANNNDIDPLVAVLMSVGVGTLLGAVNGVIIAFGRVPAIITTLGTLAIYRTMLVEYADSRSVITSSLPEWIVNLPQQNALTFGDFQVRQVVVVALIVVVVFQMVITYLPWGRRIYAIGSNPEAARISGFSVPAMIFSTYTICGALAGLAGFLFLARFGTVTVVAAQGMELQVVTAVVVGGVNIFGGTGSMVGVLLGTLLIATLEQSLLRWAVVSEFWRDAVLGMLILLSVVVDAFLLSRLRRIWASPDREIVGTSSPLKEQENAG